MKKLLCIVALMLATICMLSSCGKESSVTVGKDGYLIIDGVKTGYKLHTEPEISVIDGYVAINGVKTEYIVGNCPHIWKTDVTVPTCTTGGYEVTYCELCGSTTTHNEKGALGHAYALTLNCDANSHWNVCTRCSVSGQKTYHTLNEEGVCTACGVASETTPGILYELSEDGTYAIVVGYEGTTLNVKIADTYEGVPVTTIDSNAFQYQSITSVYIPDSVTNIGNWTFYDCESLTHVVMGENVTSIGNYTFRYCKSLVSINIGSKVESIGTATFSFCTSLTSVLLPDSIESIGYEVFYNSGLTDIFYTGSADDWAQISIDTHGNTKLSAANFHYNYDLGE